MAEPLSGRFCSGEAAGERPLLPRALARHPGFVLIKAAHRAHEVFDGALLPLGIRPRHYGVLSLLAEYGPFSQQMLCERMRVDRTTMVAIIDDLERDGFAARRPSPADRRAHAVQITPEGEALLLRAREAAGEAERRLFAPLTDGERRALHGLLLRLCGYDAPPEAPDAAGAEPREALR